MRIIISGILFLVITNCFSQQENQITQFAHNKSIYNPAFTSIADSPDISLLYRHQWAGIEGAPTSQIINIDLPVSKKNIGLGVQMQRSTIGIQEKLDAIVKYSYKLRFKDFDLGLGLQGSARRFTNDFTDPRLLAIDGFEMDQSIERIRYSNTIINLGLGGVIHADMFYIGASIPRIIKSNLDFETEGIVTREVRHAYLIAGSEFIFASDWKFKPQVLFKYAEKSPNDLDFWTEFIYRDQIFLASNLRMGGSSSTLLESTDLIIGFKLGRQWFASLAFDFTFTELRNYENGSFEFMIKYSLPGKEQTIIQQSPRYY